jgi:hypothetical protein
MSTNNKCKKTIGKVDKAAVEASRELSAKKAPIKMLEEQNRDYESIMMDLLFTLKIVFRWGLSPLNPHHGSAPDIPRRYVAPYPSPQVVPTFHT